MLCQRALNALDMHSRPRDHVASQTMSLPSSCSMAHVAGIICQALCAGHAGSREHLEGSGHPISSTRQQTPLTCVLNRDVSFLPQVKLGAVLGEGSFGTTYRGRWRGADCAVKVVRISKPDEANSFLREVEALSLLRHPNIMPFFGALVEEVLKVSS